MALGKKLWDKINTLYNQFCRRVLYCKVSLKNPLRWRSIRCQLIQSYFFLFSNYIRPLPAFDIKILIRTPMRQNFYIQWTDPFFFHYHFISPKVWDSTEKEKANLPIYNHLSFFFSFIYSHCNFYCLSKLFPVPRRLPINLKTLTSIALP